MRCQVAGGLALRVVLVQRGTAVSGKREVADVTGQGVSRDAAQIAALRGGTTTTTASRSQLAGLAGFFGVRVEYFHDDAIAARTDEELEELRALQELRAMGAQGLRLCNGGRIPRGRYYRELLVVARACHRALANSVADRPS